MTLETLLSLSLFAFVTAMTPGPNNLMLLASGVNFGFRRTLPHMAGIAGGFAALMIAVGAGIGAMVALYPGLHLGLKLAGAVYLLFLAWKIASAAPGGQDTGAVARPLSLLQAAAFQWVNPKGWVMAISAFAIYGSPRVGTILLIVAIFFVTSIISVASWAAFGSALRNFLADPARLKWFNIAMGVLLVASVGPMVL